MDVFKIEKTNWLINFGILTFDENYKTISSEAKKKFWMPDNLSQNCFFCEVKFSMLFDRRHHCRICGNIFCNNCTSKQIQFVVKDKNENDKFVKIKVCDYCFKICILFDDYYKKNCLNNINKFNYFCKYLEISKKNNEKFLGVDDYEKENEIKRNIDNSYDIIIQNMIKSVLKEYFDDNIVTEWKNTIYKIVTNVVSNLRNSYFFLDDSLDINKYIKVKQIEYKDNSLSEVIPGLVIKTESTKKYENTTILNPKILLINLESNAFSNKLDNFSNSFKRNNGYIKIIIEKINSLNPDIIIIGKNYAKIIQNILNNTSEVKNKYIFFDIKKKHLNEISRTTCNFILPSFNIIGNKNPSGKCKKFYMKKMNTNILLIFEGFYPSLFNSIILSGKNNFFLKKLKNILKSIILPSARDLYLQRYIIYDFNMKINNNIDGEQIFEILEKNKIYRPNQIKEKKLYSFFDIIKNKFDKILYKDNINNINKKSKLNKSYEKREIILKNQFREIRTNNNINELSLVNINSSNTKSKAKNININININECFYNGFDLSLIYKKSDYINYSLLKFWRILDENKNNNNTINNTNDNNTNQIILEENGEDANSLDEKEIQKKYRKCKNNLKKIFFSFFSDNKFRDKTVFQYFYDFFKNSKKICKNCEEPNNKHLFQFYKTDTKITIKFITQNEYNIDKIMEYLKKEGYFDKEKLIVFFNIYTYGYCNICKNIVTPLIKLNNEILNYSMAKLFKFFFENLNLPNNYREYKYNIKNIIENKNPCNHIINKNISRIFITERGSCVFDYSNLIKYFLDPTNINAETNSNLDINNNLNLSNAIYNLYSNDNFLLIEQLSNEAHNNSKIVLEIINELFNAQIVSLKNLLIKEKLFLFHNNITNLINTIVMAIKLVENIKTNIFKFMDKDFLQENENNLYYLKYIILIKKIYLKIVQIKSLSNKFGEFINKIKIISDILYSKIPYSYAENEKLLNKVEIPIELQKLENKREYTNILNYLDYYDNRHNFLDIEYRKEDLSNIISNVLSSDDYINFIDNIDSDDNFENIKFSKILCKRINNSNLDEEEIKKNIYNKKNIIKYLDINDLLENSMKTTSIYEESLEKSKNDNNKKCNNINLKHLDNSSFIFNLEKNIFSLNKTDNSVNTSFKEVEHENKNILEFLKKQLLSKNKDVFNFTIINGFDKLLKNYYIKKNFSSSLSLEKSPEQKNNDNNNSYFKEEDEENEQTEKDENELLNKNNKNLSEALNEILYKINEQMTYIKNQLNEFSESFIENQRKLNIIIKESISEQKQNNLSRDSSTRSLFNVFNRSRKNSTSSKGSNDSSANKNNRKSLEVEYKEYGSKSFKLDSNSIDKLNETNNINNFINNDNNNEQDLLPKFNHMPDFLKIFELKKINYLEDKIISKNYPEYEIKIFYPRQFQALRTLYFSENYENFIFSIKDSENWELTGGKSKAKFYRTLDEKFALKKISESEFNMLLDSANNYFNHLSKYFFEKKPTLFAKIFGAFHIKVKSPKEKEKNYYLIYMENIYYNILTKNNFYNFNTPESNLRVYDLKGSKINRYIRIKERKKGKILLDTNFLEDMEGEPLFLDFDNYKILKKALINDCIFLKKEGIIDYSLLIIFEIGDIKEKNENKFEIKKIRMGIIDYLRKYTWDKQIESYGKKIIHGFSKPTIINPEKYCERFIKKFKRYFACV